MTTCNFPQNDLFAVDNTSQAPASEPQRAGRAGKNPRYVSRGLNYQESVSVVSAHWLRGSISNDLRHRVESLLENLFGIGIEKNFGHWFFEKSVQYTSGVSINYDVSIDRIESHKGRFAVEIPGQALDILEPLEILNLFKQLKKVDFKCSRIDLAFDDFERVIEPRELYEVTALGGDIKGFRRVKWTEERIAGKEVLLAMCTFGRRGQNGSGKYIRVYDKKLETDGQIDAVRWEVEFSGKKADKVFQDLCQDDDLTGLASRISQYIGGSVDFPIRTGDHHVDRLERHSFWMVLVEKLGSCVLRLEKVGRSVAKAVHWVEKTVSSSLGMIRSALGTSEFWSWIEAVVDTGEGRLSAAHENILREHFHRFGVPEPVSEIPF